MSNEKYDDRDNLIYKYFPRFSCGEWYKYDENNNRIYSKNSYGEEQWWEYDENNNVIHCKNSSGFEHWYKWNKNKEIYITEKEYKNIEFRKQEKEYLNRTKVTRFEIMDI